jgi:hypothetical protein
MLVRRDRCLCTPPCSGSGLARSVPSASATGTHQLTSSDGSPPCPDHRRRASTSLSPGWPSNTAIPAGPGWSFKGYLDLAIDKVEAPLAALQIPLPGRRPQ